MLRAFTLVGGSIGLIYRYKLGIADVWIALLAYPIAIVPHTYVASLFFTKEGTSQNFTLFINMFFAALLAIGVFVMRLVK
jgi:hypothetical protein